MNEEIKGPLILVDTPYGRHLAPMRQDDIVGRLEWFHEHGMCSDFKLIWDAREEIGRLREQLRLKG